MDYNELIIILLIYFYFTKKSQKFILYKIKFIIIIFKFNKSYFLVKNIFFNLYKL